MGTEKIKETVLQLQNEVDRLEGAIEMTRVLIDEKIKQIHEFNLLVEKVHEEAGNAKTKFAT